MYVAKASALGLIFLLIGVSIVSVKSVGVADSYPAFVEGKKYVAKLFSLAIFGGF